MNTHALKCWTPFFDEVVSGVKTFELRRNDRNYHVGDTLHLREWTGTGYSARECLATITYVLTDADAFGLRRGYVALGIERRVTREALRATGETAA